MNQEKKNKNKFFKIGWLGVKKNCVRWGRQASNQQTEEKKFNFKTFFFLFFFVCACVTSRCLVVTRSLIRLFRRRHLWFGASRDGHLAANEWNHQMSCVCSPHDDRWRRLRLINAENPKNGSEKLIGESLAGNWNDQQRAVHSLAVCVCFSFVIHSIGRGMRRLIFWWMASEAVVQVTWHGRPLIKS